MAGYKRRTPQNAYTDETIVMPKRRPAPDRPVVARRAFPMPRRPRTIIRRTLLGALALTLIILVLAYVQMLMISSQIVVSDVRENAPAASPLVGNVNVLIIGVDERPDNPEEGVRSDTLIVAHLDTAGRWTSLLSIPRDTLAAIPDLGDAKINAAYGYGYANAEALYGPGATPKQAGMAVTAQTVEQLLGWPDQGQRIDYVAQVNFDGFANVIDALGGVTIDVPKLIVDDEYPTADFGVQRIEFQPGVQRMDGQRALIYARTRHADSDFDRGARQQQVIRAIADELRRRGPIGQLLVLPRLGEGLNGTVATTLPIARPDTLLALAWLGSGLNPDEIGRVALSPETDPEMFQDGNFNLIWSRNGIRAATSALLTPPSEAREAATVQVLNGAGIAGLAGSVSGELETAGFSLIPAADAPTADVQQTIVYDVTGNPRTARRLADMLRADVRQGAPEGFVGTADVVVVLGQDAAER
jgi:LCP family protein required for cell wall assembly